MLDTDYSYLAARLVVEQNRTRIAACPEAAVAHQKMADAYLGRLQSMMLAPDKGRLGVFSVPQNLIGGTGRGEGDIVPNPNTRNGVDSRGNPL